MRATNLKIALVILATVAAYTVLANAIPQVESEVPTELALSADATPEQLVAAGEELYNGAGGCTACHGLGTRAPNLLTDEGGQGPIGARCGRRAPGLSCKEYLYQSLTEPNRYVVPGYGPIMPDMRRTLSPAQIWALVAYLESLGGTVDVTGADIAAAGGSAPAGAGPGATPTTPATATLEPIEIFRQYQCAACHKLGDEGGAIGPDLSRVGARLTPDRIRRAILDPNAEIAPGYEKVAGVMPTNFGQQLTAAQLEALVQFLAARK